MALRFSSILIIIGVVFCVDSIRIGKNHQIVHLLSVFHNNHLTVSHSNATDKNRRNVITENQPDPGKKEWRLVPAAAEPTHFEIIHHQLNEPLCPTGDDRVFDDKRRNIFTWIPGPWAMRCFWEIKPQARGHYLISSVEYGEFLYAAEWPAYIDRVWTRRVQPETQDKQYHWEIVNVNHCMQTSNSAGGIIQFK